MQTKDELAVAYHGICRLHDQGTWRLGPPRPIILRLTSMDGPKEVCLPALEGFISYSHSQFGIAFDLVGGGTGCFDLVLGAEAGQPERLVKAIEHDQHFQLLLNELNVHLMRLQLPTGMSSYAAHVPIKAGLITNRCTNMATPSVDPLDAFGSDIAEQLSFGIVEFQVLDFTKGQAKSSILTRTWRRITLGLGDIRNKRFSANVARLDIVNEQHFLTLVAQAKAKALLLSIHGYANDFPAAMESFARFIYNTGLDRLAHFPVLFSWPASGNPLTYLPQTTVALNSRKSLAQSFNILCEAAQGRPVNAIAHSHGNDILVAVARDRAIAGTLPRIHRAVFVEPDVDEKYLSSEFTLVSQAVDSMTIYHSSNDMALALSGTLFGAKRAGAKGLAIDGSLAGGDVIDVIDASAVATGLSKHAPHLDAAEVIYDIRDLLENRPAESRALYPGLRERFWQVRPLR